MAPAGNGRGHLRFHAAACGWDNLRIVAEGSPDELERRISGDVVSFEIDDGGAQ
ncbi:hypothetical protein OIE68_22485 [Nocardia vinacea]|uniref:Uncharacterized protein n=1 Tax=Nocardia vinacea TaxID=96468 RepID=A0ABZ1YYA3_9NOCA|nr:hypothetical protein OIE68_22485 [Nocardia vinacea]